MRSIISAGEHGALGQEDVGADGAVEGVDGAGDDHGGQAGMELLGAADEFVAVHLGHEEVAEKQIDGAGEGMLTKSSASCALECGDDAIAAGFEKEGSNGEDLFVVVDAEDGLLGAHALGSAGRRLNGGLAADGPARRVAGWQAPPAGRSNTSPVVRLETCSGA